VRFKRCYGWRGFEDGSGLVVGVGEGFVLLGSCGRWVVVSGNGLAGELTLSGSVWRVISAIRQYSIVLPNMNDTYKAQAYLVRCISRRSPYCQYGSHIGSYCIGLD
jgi:hypothetical protein